MAEKTSLYFLIQWEDRFLSVIRPNLIVNPKKDACNYREGEIIRAIYGPKTYEAVICEIHSDKKLLDKRAALPPKYSYDVVKNQTKGVKESMRQQVTEVETPEPSNQATEERAICTPVETKKPGVNQSMGQEVIDIETSKPTKEVTEKAATCIVVENSDSDSTSMLSGKRKPDVDDGLELKEDVYRLRRKLRKLEERVAALESKKATDGQTDKISKLIDHLAETDVQSILTTLAKEIFSEDTLINCSRTGKKTSKCSGTPRPPLDAEKLLQLETIVRKKTKISKETFHKKLENLQKTLRQKRKLF